MSDSTVTPADLAPKPTPLPPTSETENTATGPIRLPDDHPLVRAFAAQKEKIAALGEKAARLDEIEEASKTAEQKQAEEIAALRAKVSEYETREQIRAWKAEVSATSGVPADVLEGSTREAIEAHAERLKPLLATPVATPPRMVVPSLGTEPSPPGEPVSLDAQIVAAEKEGNTQLASLLKAQKLAQQG